MQVKIGQEAPYFEGRDQDGKSIKLTDFKGKKLVLYFYPTDDTESCTNQACNLRDNYELLKKNGYEVIGISPNNERSHIKFRNKYGLPFRLIADTDRSIHDKFGTWREKSLFGRNYMGTVRTTFLIDENGTITEIIEKVITKNHAAQILNK